MSPGPRRAGAGAGPPGGHRRRVFAAAGALAPRRAGGRTGPGSRGGLGTRAGPGHPRRMDCCRGPRAPSRRSCADEFRVPLDGACGPRDGPGSPEAAWSWLPQSPGAGSGSQPAPACTPDPESFRLVLRGKCFGMPDTWPSPSLACYCCWIEAGLGEN